MASIKISELRPASSAQFQDTESFLNELTERETKGVAGAAGKQIVTDNNEVDIDFRETTITRIQG